MSYFRLYPNKTNTVFRYLDALYSSNTFPSNVNPNTTPSNVSWTLNTNTGANPIMELQDGRGESALLFGFELPNWLRSKLQVVSFTCNLKLFDAGTLFEPAIKLKNVKLKYFNDNFVEGDGYSFLKEKAFNGFSNFLYRDSVNLWTGTTFTDVTTYHLNRINEDLLFDVTNNVQHSVNLNDVNPNFLLTIDNREPDFDNIYTKFIHSRHTRTVFKPYIEFFIDDYIQDKSFDCVAGENNRIYLINERGKDFTGSVVATVKLENGDEIIPQVIKPMTGVYYVEVSPTIPLSVKPEYISILWSIGGVNLYKKTIKVINPNQVENNINLENLFFYPSTPYSHNIVRQGDIIPFNVISEIRGIGNVLNLNYEYSVLGMSEFEMVPWTKVSNYKERMFFMLDTSYFFPEQQYEVFIRNKTDEYSITSHLTYKFKLTQDAQSHLRNLSASPYYSRDYFFAK